jgi:hypothetical protein
MASFLLYEIHLQQRGWRGLEGKGPCVAALHDLSDVLELHRLVSITWPATHNPPKDLDTNFLDQFGAPNMNRFLLLYIIMGRDEKKIFSEFEDEERKELIAKIISQDPRLVNLPRAKLFGLWFSDIKNLPDFANFLRKDICVFNWRSGILSDQSINQSKFN